MKLIPVSILTVIFAIPAMGQLTNQGSADSTVNIDRSSEHSTLQRVNNVGEVKPLKAKLIKTRPVTVNPVNQQMSRGNQPGLHLYVPEVNPVDFKRDFEKEIKNKTKEKSRMVDGELIITGTQIKKISDNALNVYSLITEQDSGTNVTVFIESDSVFLNEKNNPDEFERARILLYDLGVQEYKDVVAGQIKEEQKKLRGLENDLDKLMKTNEKYHADIKENEARIANADTDIGTNLDEQKAKDDQILKQKTLVSTLKTKEEKKAGRSVLKDLTKEREKMRDKNVSLNRGIARYRGNIEELEREIEKNLQEQALLKGQIEEQTAYVWGLEGKLGSIR